MEELTSYVVMRGNMPVATFFSKDKAKAYRAENNDRNESGLLWWIHAVPYIP